MSRFVLPVASVGEGISPFDGAKLYFYDTLTNNLKDTYSDADLTIENSNPVVADADGFFGDIFIGSTYKVVLKDKNDVQQYEWDPVDGIVSTATQQIKFLEWSDVVSDQAMGTGSSVTVTGIDPTAREIVIITRNLYLTGTNGLALRVGSSSGIYSGTQYQGVTQTETISGAAIVNNDWHTAIGSLSANTYAAIYGASDASTATRFLIRLTKSGTAYWQIQIQAYLSDNGTALSSQ